MTTNFTVGPAKLYHGVEDFLCECIQNGYGELSHRSRKFSEISEKTIQSMRDFFEIPQDYKIFYTYSATEGLELASKNLVSKNVTHISNGNFGNLWAKISQQTGKTVQKFDLENQNLQHGERVNLEKIFSEISEKNIKSEIICLTANETAAGVAYSPQEISHFSQQLKKSENFSDTLLGVDITSGMGGVKYDFASADIWAFSVQKALGLPAGLGIVIVSPRAYAKSIEREKLGYDVGAHHSFSGLEKKMAGKFQTPSTPNFLGIAGLGFVCQQLKNNCKTIENLEKITKQKAQLLYDFFDAHPHFECRVKKSEKNIKNTNRSKTIIIVGASEEKKRENADEGEKFLAEKFQTLQNAGVEVGRGYGPNKLTEFRIGNFPVHRIEDMENFLEKLEKGKIL